MDYIQECFATNLRRRRAFMRISQEELAELSGVSAGYIANLETGRSFPSTKVWLKISKALNVDYVKLIVDSNRDEISYTKEEMAAWIDQWKSIILGESHPGYPGLPTTPGKDRK